MDLLLFDAVSRGWNDRMTQEDASLRAEFEEQLQFEMLLTEISARFINLPAEQVESEIQDAQRRICESLHFDRVDHLANL